MTHSSRNLQKIMSDRVNQSLIDDEGLPSSYEEFLYKSHVSHEETMSSKRRKLSLGSKIWNALASIPKGIQCIINYLWFSVMLDSETIEVLLYYSDNSDMWADLNSEQADERDTNETDLQPLIENNDAPQAINGENYVTAEDNMTGEDNTNESNDINAFGIHERNAPESTDHTQKVPDDFPKSYVCDQPMPGGGRPMNIELKKLSNENNEAIINRNLSRRERFHEFLEQANDFLHHCCGFGNANENQ